jgi:uncharacterized protein
MKSKLLNDAPERTYAVVLDPGDEPVACLTRFAREHKIDAARFTAIGAFSDAIVAFFDLERREYLHIPVREQVEVLSLIGDVALDADGREPKLHVHAVLGRRDGSTCGGHLIEAHVRPTLEVMLVEPPSWLRRQVDEATGLPLIKL